VCGRVRVPLCCWRRGRPAGGAHEVRTRRARWIGYGVWGLASASLVAIPAVWGRRDWGDARHCSWPLCRWRASDRPLQARAVGSMQYNGGVGMRGVMQVCGVCAQPTEPHPEVSVIASQQLQQSWGAAVDCCQRHLQMKAALHLSSGITCGRQRSGERPSGERAAATRRANRKISSTTSAAL